MRRRVLVVWIAQAALVLGLAITTMTAAAVGLDDWSFMAVMAILIGFGLALWVRFSFGIALLMADVVYLLVGAGLASTAEAATEPTLLARALVSVLWVVGGFVGVVAIAMSTRASGNPRDDIDSVAY
jgi:hypothetical protein